MLKHKIFNELYRDGDNVWLTFDIPEHNEYYLAFGKTLQGQKSILGLFTKKVEDFQSLTVVNLPVTLVALSKYLIDNKDTYNEETDKFDIIDLEKAKKVVVKDLITELVNMGNALIEKYEPENPSIPLIKANIVAQVDMLNDVNNINLINSSGVVRDLLQNGYIPIWKHENPRTRRLTLIKQADGNVLSVIEAIEFVPRDKRSKCSFIGMSSIIISQEVAEKLKGGN